jgi:acetoin utilization protein AcuB
MNSGVRYATLLEIFEPVPELNLEEKMLVRDIMTDFVLAVEPTAKLRSARKAMNDHEIRHLPVVDEGRVIGMLSKRELASAASVAARFNADREAYEAFLDTPISGLLQTRFSAREDVVTVSPDDRVQDAIDVLIEDRLSALPVIDSHGTLVGIISYIDILGALKGLL